MEKGTLFAILDKEATKLTNNTCEALFKEQLILLFNPIMTQYFKEAPL